MNTTTPTRAPSRSQWAVFVAVAVVATAARFLLSTNEGVLADEAYYWVWSQSLDFGYFDQPPLIAWVLFLPTAIGKSAILLRLPSWIVTVAAGAVLLPLCDDKLRFTLWSLLLPPLFLTGSFAVPDAFLVFFWAFSVRLTVEGRWWGAGLAVGLAACSKLTGWLLLPLLFLGTGDRRLWRTTLVALVVNLPTLGWIASHDWITVRFPLSEGWFSPQAPHLLGLLKQPMEQALFVTPFAFAAGALWMVSGLKRHRLIWCTSVPLLLFFWLSAYGGPPEAHWPLPAWLLVGVGVSFLKKRSAKVADVGVWFAAGVSLLFSLHLTFDLAWPGTNDIRNRLVYGQSLADLVARWVVDPQAPKPSTIYTERYQEAALIQWYSGLPASVYPGCGRPNQYSMWPAPEPHEDQWFVRPSTSHPPTCLKTEDWHLLNVTNDLGEPIGRWDLFEVKP